MRAIILLTCVMLAACGGRPCPVEPTGAAQWTPAAPRLSAPRPKPDGAVRILVGGDSRNAFPPEGQDAVPRELAICDPAAPLSRAFASAQPSGAVAFLYLGDMERTPPSETFFPQVLARCLDRKILFCPVFGNHEALENGELPLLYPEVARDTFVARDLQRCSAALSDTARAAGRVYYSVDLPNKVHFVALDNVSAPGFGRPQLTWLAADLRAARAAGKVVLVGMHKALADNHVTVHSMDEDPGAAADSAEALALFDETHVALALASHEHGYWEFRYQSPAGVHGFITGGLGAPLRACAGPSHAFFHYLVVDIVGEKADVHVVDVPYPP